MTLSNNDLNKIDDRINTRLQDQKEEIIEEIGNKLDDLKRQLGFRLQSQKEEILEELDKKLQELKSDFFEV